MTLEEFREACMGKFDANSQALKERSTKNIEQYRKGDRTLRFVDKDGNPISGLTVNITQKEHDFKHGANIFLLDEFGDEKRNKLYRDTFAEYFNLATLPFFWGDLEPEQDKPRFDKHSKKIYRRPPPDLCVEYCEEKGIQAKLHCLFYDKFLPKWLPLWEEEPMWKFYEKRFAEIAERYIGKLCEFEITNEMLLSHDWKPEDGCSILCKKHDVGMRMWQMGRKYFPNEKLVINEASYLPNIGKLRYQSGYSMMLENMLMKGASIDVIGVQNHILCGSRGPQDKELPKYVKMFDPELYLEGINVMNRFGKPLEITEVSIPTFGEGEEYEQLQADVLRELYTLWFATPEIETVQFWNTADGMAWVNPVSGSNENNVRGGLFHNDMTPKLAALELKRLFNEEWHTDLTLVTDEDGYINFRGFYGDYTATAGNKSADFGIHKGNPRMSRIII